MGLMHKLRHNKNGFQVHKPNSLKIDKVRTTKPYVFKTTESEKVYRKKFGLFQGGDLKQKEGNF